MLFAQAVEALSTLATGLVDGPAEMDHCAQAAGFPGTGGITGFIAARGRADFIACCTDLASRFGDRFALPAGALDHLSTSA